MACFGRSYHLKFLKDCLSQILLGPFLNNVTHISCEFDIYHYYWCTEIQKNIKIKKFGEVMNFQLHCDSHLQKIKVSWTGGFKQFQSASFRSSWKIGLKLKLHSA